LTHRAIKALLQGRRYQPPVPSDEVTQRAPPPRGKRGASPAMPSARKLAQADDRAQSRSQLSTAQREELDRWETLGIICSANERRADDASRDVEAWLKCQFMRERVGEQFRGRITGLASFGIFVTLEDLYVEGMVHVSELGSEYFQYIEAAHELRGERTGLRYRLTDELDVQVSRVDLEARRIEFRLVRDDMPRSDRGRSGAKVPTAAELGPAPELVGAPRKAARPKSEGVVKAQAARQALRGRGGRKELRGSKRKQGR
jgi:ribonuclease R